MPRYNIDVQLSGEDGNAFSIMGRVIQALRSKDVPQHEINRFMEEATKSDYDNLLQTCMKWVNVE